LFLWLCCHHVYILSRRAWVTRDVLRFFCDQRK